MKQITSQKRKLSLLLCVFIFSIICACTTTRENSSFLDNDMFPKYVFIEYSNALKDIEINIIDQELKETISQSFHLSSDVSYNYYDYEADQLFLFGPGGVVRVDIKNKTIAKQSDISTSHVFKIEDSYATVSTSSSVNLHINKPLSFDVDYHINSILYHNGSIYISNIPLDNQECFMDTYSLQGDFIERDYFDDEGRIELYNEEVVYVTKEYYQIKDQKIKFDQPLFSIYDDVTFKDNKVNLFSNDYNRGQCSFSSEKTQTVFEKCIGYNKTDESRYIVKTKNDVIVYDSKRQSEIKSSLEKNDSTYYDVFLF